MKLEGYEIIAYDGDYSRIENSNLSTPFKILRHRPDIIGLSPDRSKICIGEAKTHDDIRSKRTKEEFVDFARIGEEIKMDAKLIIGVPKSSCSLLYKVMNELQLNWGKNIECILVPEDLFPNA